MAKTKTKLQQALDNLWACQDSIRWVNGKTPAKAWKECKRADWLLWIVAHLAMDHKYYKRALAAATSACIDVLCENDLVLDPFYVKEMKKNGIADRSDEPERALAIKTSNLLDEKGQGKTVRLRRRNERYMPSLSHPLAGLITGGKDILRNGIDYNMADDFSCLEEVPTKIHKELCDEIRRVVERPSMEELQATTANYLDYTH